MPDPIDVHVGSRVRLRRTLMGLSQDKLGQQLGLTFQQVQKYEHGANRIGAGKLMRIAAALETSVSWFFDDMPEEIAGYGKRGMAEDGAPYQAQNIFSKRETLEFVRCFTAIESEDVREKFITLIRSIGDLPTDNQC